MAVALPTGALTYAAFCAEPSRFDIYLFDIAVPNENGAWQTLRWSNDEWSTGPGETPASVYWEPRVAEGGVDYETPAFDPSNPQFGLLPPVAPAPLVVLSRDGDLDAMMHWQWSRARVTVRHGGYTSSGRVPTSSFATIGTHELDGVPTFASDRATFYLRSLDSRFLDRVERRVLHAHPGALEFDGVDGTVNFAPFAPGIRLRWEDDRTYSATAPITYERTQDVHEGDLMLALIAHHGNTTSGDYESWAITAAPSGWTLVEDSARLEAGPGDPIHRIYLYSKVATSSEPTSYTWSATNTVGHVPNRVLGFSVWYGQDGTTPTISPAASDGSSTSLTAPAATSTRINSVYLGAIVSRGQLGNPASAPPHPTGTQSLHRLAKAGGTPPGSSWQRNSVGMQAFYQYLPSTGSSGTKTITMTGGSTPAWASLACILHNREAGGQPSKLKLQNALTLQFALVPMGDLTSADQHIVGWNQAAPWRLVLNDSAHLELQWVKGSTPAATEFDDITLEADHRYHVDLIWSATQQILRVYDWITDTLTEQSESVAALSRDNPGNDDVYTIGCGAQSDGETPELPFDGQVWSLRLWNTAKTREFLDNTRVRELTHPERIDSTLIHYIPLEERTGDIVGDLSPNPADGELQSAGESNTPVWRPTLTGEADHAGEQVTCVFGHGVEYVPGQEVDSRTDGSFYLANVMPSSAVTAVYEGGAPRDIETDFFVPAPEENAYRTFLDTLPEPGTVAVYSGPMGTFYRFRTRPVLPVSCTLNGYISPEFASEVGTVGPWSAAAVAYTVLTQRGEQPIDAASEVDDAAWLALATAQPEMSGTLVLPDESITDFCRRVLGGVLGLAWTDRSGLLTCRRWDPVTYSAETPAIHLHSDVIAAGTLQAVQVAQPVIMVRTRTRRNWMPLERDQISGDVTQPATIRRLMTEWVEGAQRPHAVAAIYPHGREVEIEAYFTGPGAQAAMAAVATRLREMYQSAGQTFECSARMLSVRPELGDQATLHVTDLTFEQNDRSRLVTFDGCRFRVAYARSERRRGLETLRLWRGEMTTQQESEDIES